MMIQMVYMAEGDTAQARFQTVTAHGPKTLITRLDEEGLLIPEGDPIGFTSEGLGDDTKFCVIHKVGYVITRNTRFGYLSVHREVAQ